MSPPSSRESYNPQSRRRAHPITPFRQGQPPRLSQLGRSPRGPPADAPTLDVARDPQVRGILVVARTIRRRELISVPMDVRGTERRGRSVDSGRISVSRCRLMRGRERKRHKGYRAILRTPQRLPPNPRTTFATRGHGFNSRHLHSAGALDSGSAATDATVVSVLAWHHTSDAAWSAASCSNAGSISVISCDESPNCRAVNRQLATAVVTCPNAVRASWLSSRK